MQNVTGVQCQDDTVMDELISKLSLRFFYLDTNFDGTNIQNPLVGYVDFSLYESLNPHETKLTQIFLDENVGVLEDSYFGMQLTQK